MRLSRFTTTLLGAAALVAASAAAAFADQGVTDKEIVVGSHQDMSGPIAFWGVPVANGMRLAVEEINGRGGIHGRKIKLVVEDSSYDPKKAVLGTQKLVNRDKIFAMVGSMGTPTNLATMPLVLKKGLPHLFPLTAATQMYEPQPRESAEQSRLKFGLFSPYFFGMRVITKWMVEEKGKKAVCVLHQDDEFGLNIARGVFDQLEAMGMKAVEVTTYKRGATDYSSQIAKMRAANCDAVALGTIIRETIGAIATARKTGWKVDFYGSVASFAPEVAALGKQAVEGYYAAGQFPIHYPDTTDATVGDWMKRYKAKFGKDGNPQAAAGYDVMYLFAEAATAAGPDLTVARFVDALEKVDGWQDIFGGPVVSFSKDKHIGVLAAFIGQIQKGRWVKLTDHFEGY
jgi:ABC-type branched-subunit amino acid transport system substrate-binding protein